MSLIHNERIKLTATYLNGAAIAILAVGAFAPALGASSPPSPYALVIQIVICLLVSAVLHLVARRFLSRLQS